MIFPIQNSKTDKTELKFNHLEKRNPTGRQDYTNHQAPDRQNLKSRLAHEDIQEKAFRHRESHSEPGMGM